MMTAMLLTLSQRPVDVANDDTKANLLEGRRFPASPQNQAKSPTQYRRLGSAHFGRTRHNWCNPVGLRLR